MAVRPRKKLSHRIIVDRSLAEAMPLFTPKGEEAWVPGWSPDYISPVDGQTRKDMLFTTGEGAEKTFWTCLDWNPERGFVRYFRLTPGTRVAFVEVVCSEIEPGRTGVTVTYDVQSLTDEGDTWVDGFTEAAFTGSIGEWSTLIAKIG